MVLGIWCQPVGDLYPFSGEGDKKNEFHTEVRKALLEAAEELRPIYMCSGRRAPNDFTYLYARPQDNNYVALVFDAKHTKKKEGRNVSVTVSDQIELFGALVNLSKACKNIGFALAHDVVKLGFVTNRSVLAIPEAGMKPEAELVAALKQAQDLFPGVALDPELVTKDTLEFEPFSSILFGRLPC